MKKLYIIQGTTDFTNLTSDYTQEELQRLQCWDWKEADYKKMAGLLFGETDLDKLSEFYECDMRKEILDSTHIGTKFDLLMENFDEELFDCDCVYTFDGDED